MARNTVNITATIFGETLKAVSTAKAMLLLCILGKKNPVLTMVTIANAHAKVFDYDPFRI